MIQSHRNAWGRQPLAELAGDAGDCCRGNGAAADVRDGDTRRHDKWVGENSPNIPPLRFEVGFFTIVKTQWLSIGAFCSFEKHLLIAPKILFHWSWLIALVMEPPFVSENKVTDSGGYAWYQSHVRAVAWSFKWCFFLPSKILQRRGFSDQWFGTFFEGKISTLKKPSGVFVFHLGWKKIPQIWCFHWSPGSKH